MTWRMARSLELLLAEVNARWPDRDRTSDGGIGDTRHQASSSSDHNPHVTDDTGRGVVTARDFDKDGIDADWLAERLRWLGAAGDPRIKYVIWNRRICSSKDGWAWRPYTGSNPHDKHLHLSVSASPAGYDSPRKWGVYPAPSATTRSEDEMTPAQEAKVDELRRRVDKLQATVEAVDKHMAAHVAALKQMLATTHPGPGGK